MVDFGSDLSKITSPVAFINPHDLRYFTFSTSKNWFKTHFTKKRDKALNAIFAARKTVREDVGSQQSLHLQLKIFDTQVQPIVNYGSEFWYTGKQVDELETLHLCYIKRSLGVKISTSTLAVFGETGRFPLILQHKESILKYWFRLLSLPQDTLLRNVYVELMHTESCGQKRLVSNCERYTEWVSNGEIMGRSTRIGWWCDTKLYI